MQKTNEIATWLSIFAVIVGGSVWVGSVASEVENTKATVAENKSQIDKIRDQVPADIAGMKSKIEAIENNVKDIKDTQQKILDEVRKQK